MLDPCQIEIYEKGTEVFLTHTIATKDIEEWIKKVAKESGQKVDWYYAGGRAFVLALGDIDKVKETLKKLRPEHDELYRKASAQYMGDDYDSSHMINGIWNYSGLT